MTHKREPVAEIGAEDYLIVKHTHNVDLARRLMAAALIDENGCPAWDGWPAQQQQHNHSDKCLDFAVQYWASRLAKPLQRYVRHVPALPNSYAAAEGWAGTYHEHDQPARGAFPAVVFL
jgi:hypothetical protein